MPWASMFIRTFWFAQTQLSQAYVKSTGTADTFVYSLAHKRHTLKGITRKMSRRSWIYSLFFTFYFILRSSALPIQDQEINSLLSTYATEGISYTRTVRIYARSNRGHLRVVGSKIDCLGKQDDPSTVMVLESVNLMGHIRIKSNLENTYICVSSIGRLVLEPKGTNLNRCIFVEDYHKGFTMFKSVFNASWFLGVKKSGRVKQPHMTNRTQTATLFLVEHVSLS